MKSRWTRNRKWRCRWKSFWLRRTSCMKWLKKRFKITKRTFICNQQLLTQDRAKCLPLISNLESTCFQQPGPLSVKNITMGSITMMEWEIIITKVLLRLHWDWELISGKMNSWSLYPLCQNSMIATSTPTTYRAFLTSRIKA